MKRSQQKKIGIEAKIIRYMRTSKGISQKFAAKKCGISEQAVGHYENGRMDISPTRLARFLETYQYTFFEWEEYTQGKKKVSLGPKEECLQLLNRLDETKLKVVLTVLQGFTQ